MYPHQGAERSSPKTLSHDFSNHSLNYLSWLWSIWRLLFFFFFLLSTMICSQTSVKNHDWPPIWAAAQLCPGAGSCQVCELCFKSIKFLTWWNSFLTYLLTKGGQGREGKTAVRNAQARCCIARPEVEHFVTEMATEMLLPALDNGYLKQSWLPVLLAAVVFWMWHV